MSTICNNCGKKFESDEDLAMLLEDENNNVYTETEAKLLSQEAREDMEWFKGCPDCKTDGYLADVQTEGDDNE